MAFNDDLMDALRKSVEYYNGSHDANTAIAKVASDMGFNLDQTERLVEKFNTARTISYFEHHPDDRTQNFDIADKVKVAEYLVNGSPSEKKASSDEYSDFDYSQYYGDERDYRHTADTPDLEKMGEELLPPSGSRDLAGCSVSTLTDLAHKDILCKESEAERLEDAAGMVRADIATHLDALAGRVKLGFDAGNRYALFKEACGGNSEVFETVSSMLPGWIKDDSEPYMRKYASMAVVDLEDMADVAPLSGRIENAMKRASEFEERACRLRKEAMEMRDRLYKVAAGNGFNGNPTRDPADSGGGGGGGGGSFGGGGKGGQGKKDKDKEKEKRPNYLFSGFNRLSGTTAGVLLSAIPKFNRNKKDTDIRSTVDNAARSSMLDDFMANDPILSEADPSAVAEAYASLLESSPDVALNKEVARAFLRQAVNSVAISPFDAKQLAEYEEKLLKGNLYRRADEHEMVAR